MTLSAFVAPPLIGIDGWTNPSETWTFASATTINVPDGTKYQKGDYLKLTQTTVKYFVVVGITSNVLTVVSQDAGVTITVANATISANYFSRQANPLGLPVFTWTPGFTGFTATVPTVTFARWWVVGNQVTVSFVAGAGVSNATNFLISGLPISALTAATVYLLGSYQDNSVTNATPKAIANLSGTVLTLSTDPSGTQWTGSNNKAVFNWTISYTF